MTDDGVPTDEMRWGRPQTDAIDAVLGDCDTGEDLADVAAIVHDLRSTYLPDQPLRRHPALAAFTGGRLEEDDLLVTAGSRAGHSAGGVPGPRTRRDRARRKWHEMLSPLSGFLSTLTGKVVLGTAVAAASVGGLHAADVVDVPVLPDTGRRVEQPASPELAESQGAASSEAGDAGKETAEGNKGAASAYAEATREWTDCVAGAAAAQGDESTRTTGGFDPRSECGEKPRPGDFGLTVLPDQANEKAREAVGSAPTPATPGKPPVSVPTDHSAPEVTPAPEDPGKAPATRPTVPTDRGEATADKPAAPASGRP